MLRVNQELYGVILMDDRSTEEVYEQYKNEMYQMEERLESIQYKKRELEKEKEERRAVFREEEESLNILLEMWGECEDIGRMQNVYHDFFDEEIKRERKQEEGLESEYRKIKQQERLCEERYQEDMMQLAWREEEWQE